MPHTNHTNGGANRKAISTNPSPQPQGPGKAHFNHDLAKGSATLHGRRGAQRLAALYTRQAVAKGRVLDEDRALQAAKALLARRSARLFAWGACLAALDQDAVVAFNALPLLRRRQIMKACSRGRDLHLGRYYRFTAPTAGGAS